MLNNDDRAAFWHGFTSVFKLQPEPFSPLDFTFRGRDMSSMSASEALALDLDQVECDLAAPPVWRGISGVYSAGERDEQKFHASLEALAGYGLQRNQIDADYSQAVERH